MINTRTSSLRRHALAAGAALLLGSAAAPAAIVTIDFPAGNVETFDLSAGGATVSFFNVAPRSNFLRNPSGLGFGPTGVNTTSFDFVFDQDVELLSYTGSIGSGTPNFDINGLGVSSLGTAAASGDFAGQPLSLTSGETYTLSLSSGGSGFRYFKSWTFDVDTGPTPAPAPAPLALLLTGVGALGWLRRRRS